MQIVNIRKQINDTGESNNKENDQRQLFFQKIFSKSILPTKTHQEKRRENIFFKIKNQKVDRVKNPQIWKTKRYY